MRRRRSVSVKTNLANPNSIHGEHAAYGIRRSFCIINGFHVWNPRILAHIIPAGQSQLFSPALSD